MGKIKGETGISSFGWVTRGDLPTRKECTVTDSTPALSYLTDEVKNRFSKRYLTAKRD